MAHRTMPEWESYQKGLETLASTLGTARNKATTSKKSLTIGDLLVKVCIVKVSSWTYTCLCVFVANSKNLQVPTPILGASQVHACVRLCKFTHGG